jgi:hypothetical protein
MVIKRKDIPYHINNLCIGKSVIKLGKSELSNDTKLFHITDIRLLKSQIIEFPNVNRFRIELCKDIYQNNFSKLNSIRKPVVSKLEDMDQLLIGKTKKQLEEMRIQFVDNFCQIMINYQIAFKLKERQKNNKLLYESKSLIDKINYLSEIIKNEIRLNNQKKKSNKLFYYCEICEERFSNCQALGGHMSRSHPNQSKKYINKKRIRNSREEQRNIILNARIILFRNLGMDYIELLNTNQKSKISLIRKQNYREYKEILDIIKRQK